MSEISFTKDEKASLVSKLEAYFHDELDQDIGQFECEFLLDFISTEMGAYYYNQGLMDAQTLLASKIEDITESIYDLEKPTAF